MDWMWHVDACCTATIQHQTSQTIISDHKPGEFVPCFIELQTGLPLESPNLGCQTMGTWHAKVHFMSCHGIPCRVGDHTFFTFFIIADLIPQTHTETAIEYRLGLDCGRIIFCRFGSLCCFEVRNVVNNYSRGFEQFQFWTNESWATKIAPFHTYILPILYTTYAFPCAATALCFCDHPKPHQHHGDHNGNLRWRAAPTFVLIGSLVLFPSFENLRIIFPIVILCPSSLPLLSISPQHPCSYHPAELLTQTYKQINTKYVYHTISLYEHYVYIIYIFSLDITCMFLEHIGQVLRSRARTCERWHCNQLC